jgi:hypothetical protein
MNYMKSITLKFAEIFLQRIPALPTLTLHFHYIYTPISLFQKAKKISSETLAKTIVNSPPELLVRLTS